MIDQPEQKRTALVGLDTHTLAAIVGGAAVGAALIKLLDWHGLGWVLLLIGAALVGWAILQVVQDPTRGPTLRLWLAQISPAMKRVLLGSTLVLAGLAARFGPRDIGMVLSFAGM